jgi:class 3 adenylate cyclase
LRRLASFCRLILFDKRGTGMSDRTSQVFTLEQRMHDVQAVMDDVGSERAALFGISEGGPMSILFAATYPERTKALVLYGTYAKKSWAADNPEGWPDERVVGIDQASRFPKQIPHARLVELLGLDRVPWVGDSGAIIDQVEAFLAGTQSATEPGRELATVPFVDIVASTERAVMLGDSKWRKLLEGYLAMARRQLELFRGQEVDTAGDGMFATFDGPARAIRCAASIRHQARALDIDVRAGLHTGEVETIGGKPGGLAVHIGARVQAGAEPGEILVSSTCKDLVAGSGNRFEDRGTHALKGVPGEWRLFKAVSG